MNRTSLLVAVVAVVGVLAVPAAGVAAQETANETDADVAPGERLAGVVGVQSAEFDGEIERNAFRIGLERADDNATKARHIAEKLNETEQRLAELNERKAELRQKHRNGTISEGQYRARVAELSAETETVEEQLNRSNATAAELPDETLETNGVNATAIRTLMNDASELRGGEVSEIARSIAGDRGGLADRGAAGDRAGDRPDGTQADDRSGDRSGADQQSTADGRDDDHSQTADAGDTDSTDTDGSGSDDAEAGTESGAGGDGERAGPR
jgi:hypothetical protein